MRGLAPAAKLTQKSVTRKILKILCVTCVFDFICFSLFRVNVRAYLHIYTAHANSPELKISRLSGRYNGTSGIVVGILFLTSGWPIWYKWS